MQFDGYTAEEMPLYTVKISHSYEFNNMHWPVGRQKI